MGRALCVRAGSVGGSGGGGVVINDLRVQTSCSLSFCMALEACFTLVSPDQVMFAPKWEGRSGLSPILFKAWATACCGDAKLKARMCSRLSFLCRLEEARQNVSTKMRRETSISSTGSVEAGESVSIGRTLSVASAEKSTRSGASTASGVKCVAAIPSLQSRDSGVSATRVGVVCAHQSVSGAMCVSVASRKCVAAKGFFFFSARFRFQCHPGSARLPAQTSRALSKAMCASVFRLS